MRRWAVAVWSVAAGCGGLQSWPDGPLDPATAPPPTAPPTSNGPVQDAPHVVPVLTPEHDMYVVRTSGAVVPNLPAAEDLVIDMADELVIEVRLADPPAMELRLGAMLRDTVGFEQDLCVPTIDTPQGAFDGDVFEIRTRAPDLGQGFRWHAWVMQGGVEELDHDVDRLRIAALADAHSLASALGYGDEACSTFAASQGLTCFPCGPSECVWVGLTGLEVVKAPRSALEPLSPGDVAANPACSATE